MKVHYPGLEALPFETLDRFFKLITNKPLQDSDDVDFLKGQTNYVLQMVNFFNQKISANVEEQKPTSLLQKTWNYMFKINYQILQTSDVKPTITLHKAITQMAEMYFGQDYEGDYSKLMYQLELSFVQFNSAMQILFDSGTCYVDLLN